jgi:hypothetical protein
MHHASLETAPSAEAAPFLADFSSGKEGLLEGDTRSPQFDFERYVRGPSAVRLDESY